MVGAARDGYRSRLNPGELTTVALEPLSAEDATILLAQQAPHLRPTAHRRVLAAAAGNPHSHSSGAISLTALAEEMAAEDPALALRILWSAAQLCFWSDHGPKARRTILDAVERMVADELDPWRLAVCAYAAPIERGAYVLERARDVVLAEGDDGRAYRMLSTAALVRSRGARRPAVSCARPGRPAGGAIPTCATS